MFLSPSDMGDSGTSHELTLLTYGELGPVRVSICGVASLLTDPGPASRQGVDSSRVASTTDRWANKPVNDTGFVRHMQSPGIGKKAGK